MLVEGGIAQLTFWISCITHCWNLARTGGTVAADELWWLTKMVGVQSCPVATCQVPRPPVKSTRQSDFPWIGWAKLVCGRWPGDQCSVNYISHNINFPFSYIRLEVDGERTKMELQIWTLLLILPTLMAATAGHCCCYYCCCCCEILLTGTLMVTFIALIMVLIMTNDFYTQVVKSAAPTVAPLSSANLPAPGEHHQW